MVIPGLMPVVPGIAFVIIQVLLGDSDRRAGDRGKEGVRVDIASVNLDTVHIKHNVSRHTVKNRTMVLSPNDYPSTKAELEAEYGLICQATVPGGKSLTLPKPLCDPSTSRTEKPDNV